MVFYGTHRQLEYDFIVSPGARADVIRFAFSGARRIFIDSHGDLILAATGGEFRLCKPFAYQESDGEKRPVPCRYVLMRAGQVTLRTDDYDRSRSLTIDPVLIYSTYLDGGGTEAGTAVAVDADGNTYVVGTTSSGGFPTANAIQATYAGGDDEPFFGGDAFVTKIDARAQDSFTPHSLAELRETVPRELLLTMPETPISQVRPIPLISRLSMPSKARLERSEVMHSLRS